MSGWRTHSFKIDLQRAEHAAATIRSSAREAPEALPAGASPVRVTLPSARRLSAIYARGGDPRIQAHDAATADDPVLWVRSFDNLMLCSSGKVSQLLAPEAFAAMRSGKKPMSDAEIAEVVSFSNKFRDAPPTRWALSYGLMGKLEEIVASGVRAIDPAFEREMERAMAAPLSERDQAAREQILASTRALCAGEDAPNPWAAYREGRIRWTAQGATGALLRNKQAGWSSKTFDSLTEADYALVERLVRERQPDGLAALLSPSVAFDLRLLSRGDPQELRILLAPMAGGATVAALAACELGVNDCSANSPLFKQNCVDFGGCYLPDVAAQARYILARDGLDPQWFDREVARVVSAIYNGDLAALGIRRAALKPKP